MNTTKMVLVPAESQNMIFDKQNYSQFGGNELPPENLIIEKPKRIDRNPEKIQKLLKIALKIALNNAYDENFNIKDSNGNPVSDSDIALLLNSAISPQRLLIGEEDFIRVLYESKVDPNWIVNENIRSKLLNYYPKPKFTPPPPPQPPNIGPPPPQEPIIQTIPQPSIQTFPKAPSIISEPTKKANKRKADMEITNPKKNRQTQAWDVPLPEGDDDDDL